MEAQTVVRSSTSPPDDTLVAVAVDGEGDRFEVHDARPLFAANPRPLSRLDAFPYDVSADGQRFLVNTLVDQHGAAPSLWS